MFKIKKATYLYILCILISLLTNVYAFIYKKLGDKTTPYCDDIAIFCLEANNGAEATCTNGVCSCFHFDQDLITPVPPTKEDHTCVITDGGYCSKTRFGRSGRPESACKDGSTCISKEKLNHYHVSAGSTDMGICCPNNTCMELLENIDLPVRGTPCDFNEYSKIFPAVDGKSGCLKVANDFVPKYTNEILRNARGSRNYLQNHCFRPNLNARKRSVPLFELRCNSETNKCDCGYSQVYKSLTNEDRLYYIYDAEGKTVTADEPIGQPMVYDPKSKECRLPVGSNCTNYDAGNNKNFESCSSELYCCRKSYYDDHGEVKPDIIGYCATTCPSTASSLKGSFAIIILFFLVCTLNSLKSQLTSRPEIAYLNLCRYLQFIGHSIFNSQISS